MLHMISGQSVADTISLQVSKSELTYGILAFVANNVRINLQDNN